MQAARKRFYRVMLILLPVLMLIGMGHLSVRAEGESFKFTLTATPSAGTDASPKDVNTGNKITYNITFQNKNKEAPAAGLGAIFVIPDGLLLDEAGLSWYTNGMKKSEAKPMSDASAPFAASLSGQQVTISVPAVGAGQTLHLLVPTRVQPNKSAVVFSATAQITSGTGAGLVTDACYHRCTGAPCPSPTLSVTTTPKNGTPEAPSVVKAGKKLTFKLNVKNPGRYFPVENTVVTLQLPAGLTLDPAEITWTEGTQVQAGASGSTVTISVASLAPKEKVKITIPTVAAPVRDGTSYTGAATLVSAGGVNLGTVVNTYHKQDPAGLPKYKFDITATNARGTAKNPKKVKSGDCIHYVISLKNKDKNFSLLNAVITDEIPAGLTPDGGAITWYYDDAAATAVSVLSAGSPVSASLSGNLLTLGIAGIPVGRKLCVVIPCHIIPAQQEELFVNTPVLHSISGTGIGEQAAKPCYHLKQADK